MNPSPASLNLSFIALNRITERQAARDPKYRRDLEQRGKPLLALARTRTDAALLERLRRVGIELDQSSYAEVAEHALSAEEIAQTAITDEVRARFRERFDEDWVWLALAVLWERWFPQWPNFEQFDDQMQSGYALAETNAAAACETWFSAWEDFRLMFDKGNFKSIGEFDGAFRGTQCVFNWVQDLEAALLNAAEHDPRWQRRRLEFCEQFLEQFADTDDLTIENMRRALGEATFAVGETRKGDARFEQWLKEDPQWGWGWIGWADCSFFVVTDADRSAPRAEALLQQGLSVPGVRDREDILQRLAELCREQGRHGEADAWQAQSESVRATVARTSGRSLSLKSNFDFDEEGLPLDQLPAVAKQARREDEPILETAAAAPPLRQKVGRNDPCPCGSGKKYKKCCLAKDESAARQSATPQAPPNFPRAEAPSESTPFKDQQNAPAVYQDEGGDPDTLPPETRRRLQEHWNAFESLKHPTAQQMDAFLDRLLEFPSDATSWSDLFHRFARAAHPDLPMAFRRISGSLAHIADAGLAYFYWAAAEELTRRGQRDVLPEVAAGFQKLGLQRYDADALKHLEDWLLAAGCETETLALAEHFLPILRADDGLMPYAVPQTCTLIFELRVGLRLRGDTKSEADVQRLAKELRRGLEAEIHPAAAQNAAKILAHHPPVPAWTRPGFDLVSGDLCTDDDAWQESLRLFGALIRVARESWQVEQRPPGCTLRGLTAMLTSVYDALDGEGKPSKNTSRNLLDHLLPTGLEARLVQACREIIGVSEPRARLLLDAHGVLLRFAARHHLMSEADIARSRQALERLHRKLDGPMAE